ncbi:hypothetical protein COCON_G00129130 [Conger conger]|uniref:C2H2-type domain-containing protein n=1 Tax=Conger conger TaxID=82655 RepID=A0A9Q1DE26_CONCO|nr:hypothetical protein COCON_G00129130 [Conger conger]
MSVELDMREVKQVVVGEEIETPLDLASKNTEDAREVFVKEEPTAPMHMPSYQHESLQCFQCFITFCNSKAKERHMKKSHREEYKQQLQQQSDTLFTCYVCDHAFQSSVELTNHQAVHSKEDKPFKCPYCQESFRTFSEVTSHRRNVCPEKPYPCRECGKSFRGIHTLRTHRASSHPEEVPDGGDGESKARHCASCNGRGFKRRGRPPREVEPANGEKRERLEEDRGDGDRPETKPKARRGRPPKPAPPADPPQDQAEAEGQAEGQVETGAAPQQACPEREASVPPASQLRAQRKEQHGRPAPPRKPHACTECEESFPRPEQLEAHACRAHSAARHTCPACGKSFGRENSLRAHQQSHAGPGEPAQGDCR